LKKAMIVVGCIIGVCILYFTNPENTGWLPKCWFYQLTGLKCPACGTQRAIYQLLHFNFIAAFQCNPFLIISLPYASALVILHWFVAADKLGKLRAFCFHHTTVDIYLLLVILWWIVRNLI